MGYDPNRRETYIGLATGKKLRWNGYFAES
jgi:hypothetical protein